MKVQGQRELFLMIKEGHFFCRKTSNISGRDSMVYPKHDYYIVTESFVFNLTVIDMSNKV